MDDDLMGMGDPESTTDKYLLKSAVLGKSGQSNICCWLKLLVLLYYICLPTPPYIYASVPFYSVSIAMFTCVVHVYVVLLLFCMVD